MRPSPLKRGLGGGIFSILPDEAKRTICNDETITQKSLESDEDTDREVEELRMKERDHENDK